MPPRTLGPFQVSAIGLGCMNICHAYGPPVPEADAERLRLASAAAVSQTVKTKSISGPSGAWNVETCFACKPATSCPFRSSTAIAIGFTPDCGSVPAE